MPNGRLLPVVLVLLQSGLAAARSHGHPDGHAHTAAPHVHTGDLIDLFAPDHDRDADDHDADAIDLSDALAPTQHTANTAAVDFAPIAAEVTAAEVVRAFPVGLPPATAGPSRPLYLTFCTLTI